MQSSKLNDFAKQHHIIGLTDATLLHLKEGDYALDKAEQFLAFQQRINNEVLNHAVITNNPYTHWFSNAELSDAQIKHFVIQFSVFSNQFLVAQLHKMINADTIDEMRASKEILANELGVLFNDKKSSAMEEDLSSVEVRDFGGLEGSIEGGRFHFRAAHFELLVRMADKLGLDFRLLGKRGRGKPTTLFFCDELIRLYGNEDYQTATAASYAVENWASAGFWDQLVAGLTRYKNSHHMEKLPITFFSWHSKLEANHAHHTQEELENYYFQFDVDEDEFIRIGNEMLDGVYAFWGGLNKDRQKLH
ncbi:hypothetical protein A9Q99_22620 [Gammaproteobacteria bacterium 45_16_T64]|nr:hypothetical protein A9Q99_22620 [Gammaproteobacteria bacterium 45_16_T64]